MGHPPAYIPYFADATGVATKTNDLLTPLLSADSPPIVLPPVDTYSVASADLSLMTRGVQVRDVLDGPAGSSNMGGIPAYAATPYGTVNYTPLITKTYHLETRLSMFVTTTVGLVQFRLNVNGTTIIDPEAKFYFNDLNTHRRIDFTIPVACTAGTPIAISWSWIGAANMALVSDANDMRVLRIWA